MTQAQHELLWGSIKSAVGVVTGALLTNLADPAFPILGAAWWKHLGIACLIILLTTEGRYWNQWANSGNPRPLPDALAEAKDATKQAEAKIEEAQRIAPKNTPES